MRYIVELEQGVWLADVDGDPGRTVIKKNAARFISISQAQTKLEDARIFRKLPHAKIIEVVI